ncbi:hypothetical protein MUN79_06160 [Hymenobacter cellulosilyticus]|uniref:TonB-dependent receptor-like beta-barrel domain-containing protein n=1 Tax=Hymenobacter cellulosilyticus TaxID=2932248 RepID=A0A8T9Q7G1_9BACT|nr:TonB-dependent receptor [Hymenobacter cellulosilyticus]UOQ73517.1 hypothetical protein MUN79_06160 [Hymenobacter cellulosilyticus]
MVDVNYFRSYYNDFIGAQRFVGNRDGSRPSAQQLGASAATLQMAGSNTRILQVWTNARQEVQTQGAALGVSYNVARPLTITANYSLNLIEKDKLPEGFQTFFNTPKHKYNLGANGLLAKHFNYSVNYRWAQGHLYEMPFAVGTLQDYSTVDAYVGYVIPKAYTTIQVGGSNLFNATNTQVYGGPNIGRLVFAGLLIDIK